MHKRLALGHQELSEVIGNNCIYVDKTEYIYKLIQQGTYYFFSRPRRFGKSLLCNTLKELFLGNKKLFKGLWIYNKIEWESYPVIHLSFANISHEEKGLEQAINDELEFIAKKHNITLKENFPGARFKELLYTIGQKKKVAIIIDEYDKPIVDHITDIKKADFNRNTLLRFYDIIKDADKYIRFLFITGVSKFSKVSVFSKLNNLVDITLDEKYAQLLGWTEDELQSYFPDYLYSISNKYKDIVDDVNHEIRKWYNGYSWDGENTVYNPVSIMTLFSRKEFGNYWFETGTPAFLMKLIKEKNYPPKDIEQSKVSFSTLDKYELSNITLISLLFQTGYLTIKQKDIKTRRLSLGYPNQEVEEAFSKYFLAELSIGELDKTETLLYDIHDSIQNDDIENLMKLLNGLFKDIPYSIIEKKESYFHSIFYLIIKLLGFQIHAEVLTSDGRIDAVIITDTHIYIIEFKVNQTSEKAIQQIIDKAYADKYIGDKRSRKIIGINFSVHNKEISDYKVLEM